MKIDFFSAHYCKRRGGPNRPTGGNAHFRFWGQLPRIMLRPHKIVLLLSWRFHSLLSEHFLLEIHKFHIHLDKYPNWNTTLSGGSRIFPRGGRQLPKVLLFLNFLPKTAWKWKNLDPPGGVRVPGAPPPWIRQWPWQYVISPATLWHQAFLMASHSKFCFFDQPTSF